MLKKDKKRKHEPKKVEETVKPKPEEQPAVPGVDTDFGGLPQRDLKKSLGCG